MRLTEQETALVYIALMDLKGKVEDRMNNCEDIDIPYYRNQLWQIEDVVLRLEREGNENEC